MVYTIFSKRHAKSDNSSDIEKLSCVYLHRKCLHIVICKSIEVLRRKLLSNKSVRSNKKFFHSTLRVFAHSGKWKIKIIAIFIKRIVIMICEFKDFKDIYLWYPEAEFVRKIHETRSNGTEMFVLWQYILITDIDIG